MLVLLNLVEGLIFKFDMGLSCKIIVVTIHTLKPDLVSLYSDLRF